MVGVRAEVGFRQVGGNTNWWVSRLSHNIRPRKNHSVIAFKGNDMRKMGRVTKDGIKINLWSVET